MLLPTLVLSAVVAVGPRLSIVGVRVGAGTGHEMGDEVHTGFASTRLNLGMELSSVFDLDVSYGFSWREGRTPSHVFGGVGRFLLGGPWEFEASLFGSPLGRRDTGPAVFIINGVAEPEVIAEERFGFLSPGVGLVYASDPELPVAWTLNPSAEMTWNRLNYRIVSGPRTGQDRSLTEQELRLGMGADVTFFQRLTLGLRGDYFLLSEADPDGLPRIDARAPAEQPFTPRRYELAPSLSFAFSPAVSVQVSAGYAPYRDECFGNNRLGSLRLSVQPGRVRFFGQGTYERDVAPTGAATLARCAAEQTPGDEEPPAPLEDYETFSFGLGASIAFD